MVIVPSPGSIWDYPYLNQVTSMMGLVYGTRSKPEQDLFPSKIRIPEIHVISPLHPLSPFQYLSAFTSRPSIDYIFSCERYRFFFFSLFLFFLLIITSHQSQKKISTMLEKEILKSYHILPSSQESCQDLFIPLSSSLLLFSPPFSRIGNSILEKAKNVVDKSPQERGTYVSLHN